MKLRTDWAGFATTALMAGLACLGIERHGNWNTTGDQWTFDQGAAFVVGAGLVWLILFIGGHYLLRQQGQTSRLAYSLAGAAALLAAFLSTGGVDLVRAAQAEGVASLLVLAVAVVGMGLGYLYRRRAGFEVEGDDSQALSEAHGAASGSDGAGEGAGDLRATGQDPARLATAAAEYFAGPLQVRTSIGAILITSFSAAACWALMQLVASAAGQLHLVGAIELTRNADLNFSLFNIVLGSAMGGLLFPIPIYLAHMIARGRGYTSYGAYAGIGAALPVLAGLLMFVIGLMVAIWYVLPMALAMALYRHLAGLEPKSLPEDIEVSDRRTLIGADHARRRYNRVVGDK